MSSLPFWRKQQEARDFEKTHEAGSWRPSPPPARAISGICVSSSVRSNHSAAFRRSGLLTGRLVRHSSQHRYQNYIFFSEVLQLMGALVPSNDDAPSWRPQFLPWRQLWSRRKRVAPIATLLESALRASLDQLTVRARAAHGTW